MTIFADVVLDWPDHRLSPNARSHWRLLAEVKRNARLGARFAVMNQFSDRALFQKDQPIKLTWFFYPPDKRSRDDDNLVASMKSARDGLAEGFDVNDRQFKTSTSIMCETIKGGRAIARLEQ